MAIVVRRWKNYVGFPLKRSEQGKVMSHGFPTNPTNIADPVDMSKVCADCTSLISVDNPCCVPTACCVHYHCPIRVAYLRHAMYVILVYPCYAPTARSIYTRFYLCLRTYGTLRTLPLSNPCCVPTARLQECLFTIVSCLQHTLQPLCLFASVRT